MERLIGVCWLITDQCNLNCPICCRYVEDSTSSGRMPLNEKLKIIRTISNSGIKKMNIAGGEPLLDQDLEKLLAHGKSMGLKTALSTNGILLTESKMTALEGLIDEIQIPMDGPTADIHAKHRGSTAHFDTIKKLLPLVTNHGYQVDVSTVVTAQNHQNLADMAMGIEASGAAKWKFFQYNPAGPGRKNRNKYELSETAFMQSVDQARARIKTLDVDFGPASVQRLDSYFNISPSGTFYLSRGGRFMDYGKVLDHRDLNDMAAGAGFNFSYHTKRFWRDMESAEKKEAC